MGVVQSCCCDFGPVRFPRRRHAPRSPGTPSEIRGLRNIGNSCYMNAVLQCLSRTAPLANLSNQCFPQSQLLAAFARLVAAQQRNAANASHVREVRKACDRFIPGVQYDAHEFLESFLMEVQECCDTGTQFCGKMKWVLRCEVCGFETDQEEGFRSLSLSLPKDIPFPSLSDCLSCTFAPEELKDRETWFCPHCCQSIAATKSLRLVTLPRVLILHLRRFSLIKENPQSWGKAKTEVSYPLEGLELGEFMERRTQHMYDLQAVIAHEGELEAGHYVAEVYHRDFSTWVLYDDDYVFEFAHATQNPCAYILFYSHRDAPS